jgi:hypothetical protein
MASPSQATLYLYVDESGDLTFSPKGSHFYVFVAVCTYDPAPLALELVALRFRLLKQGRNIERFHATYDDPSTRELVFEKICNNPRWHFAAVVVDKTKLSVADHVPLWRFYSRFASAPLRFILRGPMREKAHKVLVFTDRIPQEVHREATEKAINKACRSELLKLKPVQIHRQVDAAEMQKILEDEDGAPEVREPQDFDAKTVSIPYCVYHHAGASNSWLQVADYCAWAIQSKWEHNDVNPLGRLKRRMLAPEFDVLKLLEKEQGIEQKHAPGA